MEDYFFAGTEYIRVTRADIGPGAVDGGYPGPITNWGWGAFGAGGIDAALYSGSKCYFFKGNEYIRVTRGVTGPGTVDAGYPAPISNWGWGAFGANGIHGALYSGGAYAAAPGGGLLGNSNYLLSNCSNITGLSTIINVDADIKSNIGFGFQLNAYSAKGDNADAAQQYVIMFDGTNLWGWVDNWTSANTEVVNHRQVIAPLPNATLPTGYTLQITLTNDASDRITGAEFVVWNAANHQIGAVTLTLKTLKKDNGQLMTDADLAPITAFQLNIVGPLNGERTTLSSGAGTLTFAAGVPMTAEATEPACVDWSYATVEQANCGYGLLPAAPSSQLTQYFGEVPAPAADVEARLTDVQHVLRVPE